MISFVTAKGAGVQISLHEGPPVWCEFADQRRIEEYTGVALNRVVSLCGRRAIVWVWPKADEGMSVLHIVSEAALPGGWREMLADAEASA